MKINNMSRKPPPNWSCFTITTTITPELPVFISIGSWGKSPGRIPPCMLKPQASSFGISGFPPSAIRNALPEHPEDAEAQGMKKPRRCQGVSLRSSGLHTSKLSSGLSSGLQMVFGFFKETKLMVYIYIPSFSIYGKQNSLVWKIFRGLYGWIDGMSDRPFSELGSCDPRYGPSNYRVLITAHMALCFNVSNKNNWTSTSWT